MKLRSLNKIWIYLMASLACGIIFFPLYWMFVTSIQSEQALFVIPLRFWPKKIIFDGYINVLTNSDIWIWIKNSLLVTMATTVLSVPISLLAAYSISRFCYRGRGFTLFLILFTQMLPATLIILPLFIIFRKFGMINTLFGLVVANVTFSLPLSISILKGFLDTVPREIEEAGTIDGCSRLQIITKIVVPVSLPGLVASSVISFFLTWDEFLFANTFINSREKWLGTVGLASFRGEFITPWNQILAAATLYTAPALLFFLLAQRYIVTGLTSGAVKG